MYVRKYTTFETFHPSLLLVYILGAAILSMLSNNPVFLGITLLGAFCIHNFYYGIKESAKAVLYMLPILLIVAVVNMLTNQRGMTPLFQIGHTAYTLESLCYGFGNGVMLLSVLLWCRCFSAVLSNQKFLYLFGRRFPATSLLLSMILKLFPETKHKIQSIQMAQGGNENNGKVSLKQKINHSMRQISSLLEWSMEDSIETADSMKARGYGSVKRTSYANYRFTMSDGLLLLFFVTLILATGYYALRGSGQYQYFPVMQMQEGNGIMMVMISIAYLLYLLTPIWMEIRMRNGGERTWKC